MSNKKRLILFLIFCSILVTVCKKPIFETDSTTVPGAPTGVSATAGNALATVTFTVPVGNGGSPITGYTVTSSPGGFTKSGPASPITVTGLTNGTAYTFTVTATNVKGTSLPSSASNSVTPFVPVADGDGNVYNSITIGAQIWMKENLKTTKYNDGTDIPLVDDRTAWYQLTTPGYCWYSENEASFKDPYGALYNWYALDVTSNGGKNVCPIGWHIPNDAEWTLLTNYLGGESVAGGKLKEAGYIHWIDPNTGATNESGFTALAGGEITNDVATPSSLFARFRDITWMGHWWSSTRSTVYDSEAWGLSISFQESGANLVQSTKGNGWSVRCLKD